jgi:hypothetical protein
MGFDNRMFKARDIPTGFFTHGVSGGVPELQISHYIDSMRSLLFLFVLLCPLLASGTRAGSEPYGKNYVLAGADWPGEAVSVSEPLPATEPASARELVDSLERQLAEQEFSDGPYAPVLSETLAALARAQDALGQSDAAMRSRERALHLIRVNEGLYSSTQGPLVRDMLNSLRRTRDFEALDERYSYFYRLFGGGQPPWTSVRWGATMEYLRWQREALRLGLDSQSHDRLLRLHVLNDDLLERVDSGAVQPSWQQRRDLTLSQLKTLYLIEELVPPPIDLLDQRRSEFPRAGDPMAFDLQRERLQNMRRTLQRSGRALLESLLELIPADEVLARAAIELELADWVQWHGDSREAQGLYESLWHTLQAAGLNSVASEWFSDPRPLPDNGVFWEPLAEARGPIPVLLSVSASGRARLDVDAVVDRQRRAAVRLRRYLGATRFRPAIRDGETVDTPAQLLNFIVYWP